MKKYNKEKFAVFALLVAISLPTALYARGRLNWWNSPPPPPVHDVQFSSVSTANPSWTKFYVRYAQLQGTNCIHFDDVTLTAQVTSQKLTFDQIVLVDGSWTISINVDEACLSTEKFGSKFCADATAFVDNGSDSYEICCKIHGRICEREGRYYLTACVVGSLLTKEGKITGCLETLHVPLSASAEVPIACDR